MRFPKHYGQSRIEKCPFCERQGTVKNPQGVPVCASHSKEALGELKCACGRFLFLKEGKFGVFFICTNCGNLTLRKVLEINHPVKKDSIMKPQMTSRTANSSRDAPLQRPARQSGPQEITIRSDELDL